MRLFFTVFLFAFSIASGIAENIIWTGTKSNQNIGTQVFILEDPGGNLSIEDVSTGEESQNFKKSEQVVLSFGITESFQWLKFQLKNETDEELWLELAQPFLTESDLYFRNGAGAWEVHQAGYKRDIRKSFFKNHNQLYPLSGIGGIYYLRFQSITSPVPIKIWESSALQEKSNNQLIYIGIFAGIMLFVIFNNLFLYFSLKSRIYLWYSINVFLYLLTAAAVLDGWLLYLFPKADMMFWYNIIPTFHMAYTAFYAIVFLEIKRFAPKLYKTAVFVSIYFIGVTIIHQFMPIVWVTGINSLYALFIMFFAGYMGFNVGKKGNKIGYYFGVSYIIYFLLIILQIIYIQLGTPPYLFEFTHSTLATFVETILLAYALAKRFEWERAENLAAKEEAQNSLLEQTRENEKIVRERNEYLEEKVKERTEQVTKQKDELSESLQKLKLAQNKLVASEKMASLGQLTAGVAHEINNPINFVSNGVKNLKENFDDILVSLQAYMKLKPNEDNKAALEEIAEINKKHYVEDALEDINSVFKSVENGVQRTVTIVKSLRNFSRLDEGKFKPADIHECLDSTLEILQHGIKKKAEVIKKYGELPNVYCEPGKINQVFLNIINNAVQAIEDKGTLTIETNYLKPSNEISVKISDTGSGMSQEVKAKLFDPFFTTKPVGEGTGLGMSISYGIIENHNGRIEVESELGKGSSFTIFLPVRKK